MQKIIQIHPCLLSYRINKKCDGGQTDGGYFYIPHRYRGEIKIYIIKYGGSRDCMVVRSNLLRRGVLDTTLCDKVCQ